MTIYLTIKRLVVCSCFILVLLPYSYAQIHRRVETSEAALSAVPMTIHFRFDRTKVDSTYMDNSLTLKNLDKLLSDTTLAAYVDSITVFSFASPDGGLAYNWNLSLQRSIATREYLLRAYPQLDPQRIHARPQGENWQGLRQLLQQDDSLFARHEALFIIDSNLDNARCKALLKKLHGGQTYRYIVRHIMPLLRNASICSIYLRKPLPALTADASKGVGVRQPEHTIEYGSGRLSGKDAIFPFHPTTHTLRRPLLALKTNLLFDLAMAPNIEIEVPIGSRWSVNAEGMFPWWLFKGDKYCFQILSGGLEGRYWLGNRMKRRILTGHFIGFYAGAGIYDLQWDTDGYQGEFYIASGISYGYVLPVVRNLNLEFSIGLGLMKTSYEHYHTLDNYQTLLWQDNGRHTWLGPTKAKISFVWMLNRKVKVQQKGGVR